VASYNNSTEHFRS